MKVHSTMKSAKTPTCLPLILAWRGSTFLRNLERSLCSKGATAIRLLRLPTLRRPMAQGPAYSFPNKIRF
jgi:hypothetical protein